VGERDYSIILFKKCSIICYTLQIEDLTKALEEEEQELRTCFGEIETLKVSGCLNLKDSK